MVSWTNPCSYETVPADDLGSISVDRFLYVSGCVQVAPDTANKHLLKDVYAAYLPMKTGAVMMHWGRNSLAQRCLAITC